MKKYIVLYHAPIGVMENMPKMSAEDAKKGMEPWMEWAKRCGTGLVDIGAPLGDSQKVLRAGASANPSTVVGYSILQADTMDQAVAMLKDHPHLAMMDSCQIEVHETMPLPGM
jgi:hypothetical protein